MHTRIVELFIFLDSKFILTFESHISIDWKFHSSPTYTPRFAHTTLHILGFRGDGVLGWRMLFILVMFLTILVLMTTFAHISLHKIW